MPKRRREDRSNNKAETITFSMPEDILDNTSSSYSTTMPKPTTTLSEQVFNVSEWTIETDRVSTSNPLFSSMTEPAPSMSFSESDHDLHIPGAHHNYYDVVDVSDFQPPELPQPSQSANTESSKSSKERFFSLSL
jgi:hypothetical protein